MPAVKGLSFRPVINDLTDRQAYQRGILGHGPITLFAACVLCRFWCGLSEPAAAARQSVVTLSFSHRPSLLHLRRIGHIKREELRLVTECDVTKEGIHSVLC